MRLAQYKLPVKTKFISLADQADDEPAEVALTEAAVPALALES